jgi:flagellar export protein FliJ
MPKYQSNLIALKKVRESARDAQRARVADALRAEAAIYEQITALEAELRSMATAQRELRRGSPNVSTLLEMERYELMLRGQAASLSHQKQTVAQELERRRADLAVADQQVRVVEKIDDRRDRDFVRQEARREQRDMDEIAAQHFLRRQRYEVQFK